MKGTDGSLIFVFILCSVVARLAWLGQNSLVQIGWSETTVYSRKGCQNIYVQRCQKEYLLYSEIRNYIQKRMPEFLWRCQKQQKKMPEYLCIAMSERISIARSETTYRKGCQNIYSDVRNNRKGCQNIYSDIRNNRKGCQNIYGDVRNNRKG